MTKDDFYIIRNSITMLQLANFHGFKIVKRGSLYFTLCPFHDDKNASMQIFDGYRGFYCRGCGTGGDVNKFTELYENLTPKESGLVLSNRFNIQISENGTIDESTRLKAQQAEFERQQQLIRSKQIRADLRRLGALIYGYRRLLDSKDIQMNTDTYCFIRGELPRMEFQWDELFAELRK